jgi:primosomal protein N' (replication factor Y)
MMDEEHDASFKQQDNFRYHARDLLILRASLEKCPVILGSATPSLETLYNTQIGKFHTLNLPLRAGKATFPSVQILDIRHKKLEEGLSAQLIEMIRVHTQNKNQVLLFLNRRGFAPVFMCFTCGWVASCKNCDAKLTLHHKEQKLECHHCQAIMPLFSECPSCHHPDPKPVGMGTERIEAVLKNHFPDLNIDRIDRDTTRKKGSVEEAMARLHRQETDILLGTQMIAKGHHLPHITLVAILDVDHALFSTDFRSLEKMGQLITQVAGRTGRAEKPGHVVLQTAHPEHPLLKMILEEGYLNFANALLTERKATNLPPYSYQALIRAEAKHPQLALDFLTRIKRSIETNTSKTFTILGPIPAPMERRQQQHRAQLLLQAPKRSSLQTLLSKLIEKMNEDPNQKKIRWSLDVDPIDLY